MKIEIFKNYNLSDYKLWPIWSCEPSQFNWEYEKEEHCFIISGLATVQNSHDTVIIESGDYVIFPKGLKCVWKVSKSIKKHYIFK